MAGSVPAGAAHRGTIREACEKIPLNILLDTDVLIDVALDRQPHGQPASDLLDEIERGRVTGYFSWHTASNFYYLVSPRRGNKDAKLFLVELMRFVAVAPASTRSLQYGASLEMKDFEDAMACGAEVIATRNLRDYRNSPIRAVDAQDLLALIREG